MATQILRTNYIPTDFSSSVQTLLKDIHEEYKEKKPTNEDYQKISEGVINIAYSGVKK